MIRTIPDRITIGPAVYTVSTDEVDLLRACRSDRADLLGHVDHRHLTIVLDADQAPGSLRDTLLHECLHAVLDYTGLAYEIDNDEALVRRLAPALLDLLRRNPPLVKALLSDRDD